MKNILIFSLLFSLVTVDLLVASEGHDQSTGSKSENVSWLDTLQSHYIVGKGRIKRLLSQSQKLDMNKPHDRFDSSTSKEDLTRAYLDGQVSDIKKFTLARKSFTEDGKDNPLYLKHAGDIFRAGGDSSRMNQFYDKALNFISDPEKQSVVLQDSLRFDEALNATSSPERRMEILQDAFDYYQKRSDWNDLFYIIDRVSSSNDFDKFDFVRNYKEYAERLYLVVADDRFGTKSQRIKVCNFLLRVIPNMEGDVDSQDAILRNKVQDLIDNLQKPKALVRRKNNEGQEFAPLS